MNVTLERSSCYSQTLLSDWFVAISNYNLSQHHCLYFSWASFDDDDAALLRANGSRIHSFSQQIGGDELRCMNICYCT